MIEQIEVIINDEVFKYSKGITLQEIYMEHQEKHQYPIILARVNNRQKELSFQLKDNSKVEFIDLTSPEGNRAHINGLTFMLICAVKKLFGNSANIIIQHSIDKGIYFQTTFRLTEEKLQKIKEEMNIIISKDLPITKLTIDRLEAKKYYNDIGETVKAEVLKYNTDNYIHLYRLGNNYNYFYNLMPPSTGKIKDFDLTYESASGFVLRFPTIYIKDKIPEYIHHPKMFDVFREFKQWGKLIGIENSVDLNRIVSTGKISDLIKIDETLQSSRLLNIAKSINDKKNEVKIVLIAGPSSSGKTTTSRKLCMYLKSFGLHPKTIGMDDYFVDKKENPLDENGNPDMQLEDNDILIIEGIHALDTKILTNISKEKKYKIYICPLTELNMDNHNRIPTTDNRLLRRIVRDNRTRNYSVEDTLKQWPSVRAGEEKYIFPYQDESDATINSAAIYEIGVLKTYAEPLLYSVESDSPYYEEAKRLIRFLRLFLPIPSDSIPEDAVIREFIGGGYFHE